MKKRLIMFSILIVGVLLLGWWFLQRTNQHRITTVVPQPTPQSKAIVPVFSNVMTIFGPKVVAPRVIRDKTHIEPQSVRLFKATNYPPRTTEERAQWEWWEKMDKVDSDFQWKMPIEFYGKVVDQFGQPVTGAEVELNWTTVIGPVPDPKKRVFTGSDGRFEVTDIQGKGITISVSKIGYESESDWIQSFEYAAFYQDNFHVPDQNNPVLFHLHKLLGAEPMYQFEANSEITFDRPPVMLDVATGKFAQNGDFSFSLRLDGRNEKEPDYTLQLGAQNNAGFILTTERFPFNAPENGYQTVMSIHQKAGETNYNSRQTFHFYAKSHDGKYGVVWFEVNVPRIGDTASCNATIRYNPSGSRNLEFDQNKWINR
jgi:hypothetical protein